MAYLKIQKGKKLVKNQYVDDEAAKTGIRFHFRSLGPVCIRLGETKTVDAFTFRLAKGEASSQGSSSSKTAIHSEEGLNQLQYTTDETRPIGPVLDSMPRIEGYRIIELLGQGGMGSVWRAEQLSTKREVALKVMAVAYGQSNKAEARFEREVELTASLDHSNIARLYDSGLRQGIYYYAMELLDGIALDAFVTRHKLPQSRILKLVCKVCQAVQYAHQRGVIHRDLKPANIMVSGDGEPHIVDFGLARVFWGAQKDKTISIEGEVAGTPAYMAPEQAAGHHEATDTRTDVFSLGVILYSLLTGESPHDLSGTMPDVLHRICEGQIRRPRIVKTSIDQDLEAILLKALALDMDERYLSAGALADDLANYLNGDPVSAQLPTLIYFLRKKTRKYRVQIAVALLVVLILSGAGLTGYTKWITYRTRVQEIEVEAEQGRLAQERLKWTELELMILGDDKNKARAALRNMRDLHIDALDQNTQLKANKWVPPPVVRRVGLETGQPLSRQSLIKRPALPPGVQSWTIETRTHRGSIHRLSGSPEGHRMASSGADGTIRVWDKDQEKLECIFMPLAADLADMAWTKEGHKLVSGSCRPHAEITVWDVGLQEIICAMPLGQTASDCLAISPDADFVACRLSTSGDIQIWEFTEIDNVRLIKTLPVEPAGIRELVWAHDAQSLAMIDENGNLSVWNVRSGESVFRLSEDHPRITAMTWSAQDTHLAVSFLSDDQAISTTIELWDIDESKVLDSIHVQVFSDTSHPITQLAWSSDGQNLAYLANGNVALWHRETRRSILLDITNATELNWFKNSDLLAVGDSHGSLYWLEKNTGRITQSWISTWCGPAYAAEYSPQGDRLAVLSGNGSVSLWETRTWTALGGFQVKDVDLEDHVLAWSSSGNEVIVGTADGKSCTVYDSHSLRQVRSNENVQRAMDELNVEIERAGKLTSTFSLHDASLLVALQTEILSVTQSPVDRYVLATAADGTVRVWDAENNFRAQALLMPLWGSTGSGIAFSHEGDFRGSPEAMNDLRYVVQTRHGQKTWRPDGFRNEHGWTNQPWQVGVLQHGDEAPERIYVKADTDGLRRGDGLSWGTAFTDLQDALGKASAGTEIWVAAGTYKPDRRSGDRDASFQLKGGVCLYGGFSGNETGVTQRDASKNPTILSGDLYGNGQGLLNNDENSYHVVLADHIGEDSLLDGFVITGGNANKPKPENVQLSPDQMGGGALVHSCDSLIIQNCVFEFNFALYDGGGLGLYDGTITVNNCQFIENESGQGGGGATLHGGASRLSYCVFRKNKALVGGGLSSHGSTITDCQFIENEAAEGGGVAAMWNQTILLQSVFYRNHGQGIGGALLAEGNMPVYTFNCMFIGNNANGGGGAVCGGGHFENCGFVGNAAGHGGAIDYTGRDMKVVNCTLIGNKSVGEQRFLIAGGICHDPNEDGHLRLYNSILYDNSSRGAGSVEGMQVQASRAEIFNCCIQGWTGQLGGQGNIDANPRFSDINGADNIFGSLDDDFSLHSGSPCIDQGNNAWLALDTHDLDSDHDVNELFPLDLLDGVRVVGETVDMGAIEAPPVQ